jgi:glycosyltransferase involved in cell wall biosynthesis
MLIRDKCPRIANELWIARRWMCSGRSDLLDWEIMLKRYLRGKALRHCVARHPFLGRAIIVPMDTPLVRVLYFTIVDIGRVDNGGGLVCGNHAARIAETPNISLTICVAGSAAQRPSSEVFARELGADLRLVEFGQDGQLPRIRGDFPLERWAAAQSCVHRDVANVIDEVRPEIVIVDYLFSALFAPAIYRRRNLRRITITLNRESRFLREQLASNPSERSQRKIARFWLYEQCRIARLWLFAQCKIARLWLFEQSIYARSHAVVALNDSDVTPFPWVKRVVIAPIIGESPKSWHGENGCLFFVGNVSHFPNRQAVAWLCFKFAPEFAKHNAARIVIVGAGSDAFPSGVPPNVDLLGPSTREAVEQLYQGCGLFVAPIANNHGSKIKLLQCLSVGTPFLATRNALTGLRGLDAPLIDLNDAPAAAVLAASLLSDHEQRVRLSRSLRIFHSRALDVQRQSWRDLLHSLVRFSRPSGRETSGVASRAGGLPPTFLRNGKDAVAEAQRAKR